MKTKLLFITLLLFGLSINAQDTTVDTSMGAGYTNQVYYKLSTETETSFVANIWDIAFLRVSTYEMGIRVNAQLGIEVYEVSNTPSDWADIDVNDEASWSILYNDNTAWDNGAFMQGSATYGFGEYNPATHHVSGTIIFILKYADGTYVKFINEDFYGGYTFKYATWNGSSWSTDTTYTLSNTTNPDNRYNYYSIQNNTEVIAEPAQTDWDFMFTKYYKDLGSMFYSMTGVLHSNLVQVAENTEADVDPIPTNLSYSEEINSIGDDWKTFEDGGYTVDSNKRYYVKYEDGSIYRMYFTTFEGSSTGNSTFKFREVTNELGLVDVTDAISFGIYPNPTTNKKISIIYNVENIDNTNNELLIYTLNGRKVYQKALHSNTGFYNQQVDISNLKEGVYLVQFKAGDKIAAKKLIVQ